MTIFRKFPDTATAKAAIEARSGWACVWSWRTDEGTEIEVRFAR